MTIKAMTPLRQRMLEDMQLRGLSARTQEAYARARLATGPTLPAPPGSTGRGLRFVGSSSSMNKH